MKLAGSIYSGANKERISTMAILTDEVVYGGTKEQIEKQLACEDHNWYGPCVDGHGRYFKCTKCFCLCREMTTWLPEPTLATIAAIYDSEINGEISWNWDAGFTAKIGDKMNGYKAEATFESILEAVAWMKERAVSFFPTSSLATNAH